MTEDSSLPAKQILANSHEGVVVKTLNDENVEWSIFNNFRIANDKITKVEVFGIFIFDRSLNRINIFGKSY